MIRVDRATFNAPVVDVIVRLSECSVRRANQALREAREEFRDRLVFIRLNGIGRKFWCTDCVTCVEIMMFSGLRPLSFSPSELGLSLEERAFFIHKPDVWQLHLDLAKANEIGQDYRAEIDYQRRLINHLCEQNDMLLSDKFN